MITVNIKSNANELLASIPYLLELKPSVMDEIALSVQEQIQFRIWGASSFFIPNKKGTRLLYKSGKMHDSIKWKPIYTINRQVYTELNYAEFINDGVPENNLESRPFFMTKDKQLSPDIKENIYRTLSKKKFSDLFVGFDNVK